MTSYSVHREVGPARVTPVMGELSLCTPGPSCGRIAPLGSQLPLVLPVCATEHV